MGFASCLRYYSDVAHWRPTKLSTMFGHLLGWYTIYKLSWALALDRILPGAKFTILAALLHGTPAGGVSQTLWRGTRNGITEHSQRKPPIFGRATITLGIGPHSSITLLRCVASSSDLLPRSLPRLNSNISRLPSLTRAIPKRFRDEYRTRYKALNKRSVHFTYLRTYRWCGR